LSKKKLKLTSGSEYPSSVELIKRVNRATTSPKLPNQLRAATSWTAVTSRGSVWFARLLVPTGINRQNSLTKYPLPIYELCKHRAVPRHSKWATWPRQQLMYDRRRVQLEGRLVIRSSQWLGWSPRKGQATTSMCANKGGFGISVELVSSDIPRDTRFSFRWLNLKENQLDNLNVESQNLNQELST